MHSITLPSHPRTGLRAVGIVAGRPVWPILGGEESDDAAAQAAAKATADATAAAAANYTAPASQADLDKIIQDRVARVQNKFSDYDELKAKAAKADQLEADLGTDVDKATKKARDEERTKANSEWTPRVVNAEFRAAAKGVLTAEQTTELMEMVGELDLSKYVDSKGDPDVEKIEKRVKAFGPTAGTGAAGQGNRNLGQGKQPQAATQRGDAGRAAAEKRFGKKVTT